VTEAARLDARGLLCDQAVLAAMRAIRGLPPAGRLEVVTAAESVRRDLRAWADRLGHPREPERDGEAAGEVVLTIRKRERA
jgi:TusA-related sulfurtransferase